MVSKIFSFKREHIKPATSATATKGEISVKKTIVFSTQDHTIPDGYLQPEMFSNSAYDGMHIYNDKRGGTAILLRSDRVTPMPWCLFSGIFSTVFFPTYKEAMDYCNTRGYRLVGKGGK